MRDKDVGRLVKAGAAAMGFAGSDTWGEWPEDPALEWRQIATTGARFVLAGPNSSVDLGQYGQQLVVATSYPQAAAAFVKHNQVDMDILPQFNGSLEALPELGICDAIYDIHETGRSLRENRLKPWAFGPRIAIGAITLRAAGIGQVI